MGKIILKSESDFENSIDEVVAIKGEIERLLELQDTEFDKIDETSIWTSPTQKDLIIKYKDLKNSKIDIDDSLNNYVSFMRSSLERYRSINTQREYNIDYHNKELDVTTDRKDYYWG